MTGYFSTLDFAPNLLQIGYLLQMAKNGFASRFFVSSFEM